jgi:hypothetical protein
MAVLEWHGGSVFMERMQDRTATATTGYARRMSGAVSTALVAYAVLQVALAMALLPQERRSALPYVGLGLLVIGVIPACRAMEARWARLGDGAELESRFRRERRLVWAVALGLPFILAGAFRAIGL